MLKTRTQGQCSSRCTASEISRQRRPAGLKLTVAEAEARLEALRLALARHVVPEQIYGLHVKGIAGKLRDPRFTTASRWRCGRSGAGKHERKWWTVYWCRSGSAAPRVRGRQPGMALMVCQRGGIGMML